MLRCKDMLEVHSFMLHHQAMGLITIQWIASMHLVQVHT